MGEGGEAIVYKIPSTGYCVRINKDTAKDYDKSFTLETTAKDKVNHVVARLGNGSSIMTIVEGETLWKAKKDPLELAKNIQAVEEIPVEGFKNLIAQVCHANKHDMIFDSIGANIIVDTNHKKLIAIDFFQSVFNEPITPLKSIYSALTHFDCPMSYKRSCAQKLILAACEDLKEGEKSVAPMGGYDFDKLVFHLAQKDIIKDKKFTGALYNVLDKIFELHIKKYVGQNCDAQLEGQMKVLKALLRQVF
jgi:hypothetical protein